MKNQLQQYKTRVSATEAVERKLKSQLSSYHSTYQIELEEMRKKLSDERGLNLVLQDQNTKLKKIISQQNLNHDFDEYKNSILKQLIEKDEQINSLSLQVHELKSHLRQLETKEFENRLKQLERSDYETKSPYYTGTEENFTSIKASARSKSPYYGDGTSVLESIIGSFPQERASVVSSSGYLRKSGQEDYLREQRGDHLYDFDCHQQMRESNRNNATDIWRTSRKLNLNNLNKECYQVPGAISTKTDRTKYFNSNNKKSVNQHEEQKMTKNQSWANLSMSERQRTSTEGDSYQRNKSHSRNISQNNKNDLSYLQGYIGEQSSEEVIVREERNIPYQDTFDNAGTQNNEPLASSRYKHVATIENDSVSTERGRNPMTTRIRHHRNISHNSFPSEDSDKESNDKVLNKHAQSVLQYKERNKNNQTKTLKINIEVSDSEIQKEKKPHSYAKTSRTDKLYSFNNKENNPGISNLKTVRKEYKPSSTRKHMGNITPRNAKYPPKYSPSDLEVSKSLNLVVHTKGRRTRHRRNISSGYYPFCVTKKDSTEGKVHGSLLQYKKTSVQKLENDEASNFNLDDMDEASSQWVFRDDVSDSQHKNPDPSVYSAKYSYKSYMKKDSSNIEQRDKVQKGFKTYELK